MERIAEAVELIENVYHAKHSKLKSPDLEEIEKAEEKLGLKFAEDFKLFMKIAYGLEFARGEEFCKLSDVVNFTECIREDCFYENFPSNLYVVLDYYCETQCILQDETGVIYFSDMYTPPVKIFDSLADYIYFDAIPEVMFTVIYDTYTEFYESEGYKISPRKDFENLTNELKTDRKWFDEQYGLEYYFLVVSDGFKNFLLNKKDSFADRVKKFFGRKTERIRFKDVVVKYIRKTGVKSLNNTIPKSDNEKYDNIKKVEEFNYYVDSI